MTVVTDTDTIKMAVEAAEQLLHAGKMRFRFTKKDGTERTMLCTQNHALIPESKMPKVKPTIDAQGNPIPLKTRTVPLQLVVVFDLEKQEWRSFNITSVKNMEVVRD